MGWWIELRCEGLRKGCVSGQNDGPMAHAATSQAAVMLKLDMLRELALAQGWVCRPRIGWLCPACKEVLK